MSMTIQPNSDRLSKMSADSNKASRRWEIDLSIAASLIATATVMRILLADIPNFAPIAAFAFFAGLWISRPYVALLVPIASMMISDRFIG